MKNKGKYVNNVKLLYTKNKSYTFFANFNVQYCFYAIELVVSVEVIKFSL